MKSPFTSSLYALAAFTILRNQSSDSLRISKYSLSPQIWLSGFKQVGSDGIKKSDLRFQHSQVFSQNDIYKNETTYSILANSDVWMVYFTCEAFYPIRWNIPFPQQFSKIGPYVYSIFGERTSYFNDELHKPVNSKYSLTLEISSSSVTFLAGNITCESFKNETKHSSIYLYIEGDQAIQYQHQTIIVNVTSPTSAKLQNVQSKSVLLPCRPGLPDLEINLFKKVEKRGETELLEEWIPLPRNDSINFDPAFGFTLSIDEMSSNILGEYKCQVVQDEDVFVTVLVKVGDELELEPAKFELKQILKSKDAKLIVENGQMKCCTGNPGYCPDSNSLSCHNENQCDILKSIFSYDLAVGKEKLYSNPCWNESNCFIADMIYTSEVLICRSPELDLTTQFIRVYDTDKQKKLAKLAPDEFSSALVPLVWPADHTHLHDLSAKEPSIEEKIYFAFATPMEGDHYRGLPYSSVEYFLHTPDYEFLYIDDKNYQPDRKVKYLTYHGGNITQGEHIFVICYSLSFYYSRGGWIRLNWKNGTKTLLTGHINSEDSQVAYMGSVREVDNTIIANLSVADENMESVDCFVPQWNNDKWDQRQFKLTINTPVPPKFWNEEEVLEILLDTYGSSRNGNEEMTCSLAAGIPTPKIVWEKDGVVIKDWNSLSLIGGRAVNFGNATSNTVRFWNITDDLTGTYACIAENLAGRAVKAFKMQVWEYGEAIRGARSTRIVFITLTCIVGVFSLAVIILFKMKKLPFRNLIRFLPRL